MRKLTTLLLSVSTVVAFAQSNNNSDNSAYDDSQNPGRERTAIKNWRGEHVVPGAKPYRTHSNGKVATSQVYFSEDFATPLATSPNGPWVVSGGSSSLVGRSTSTVGPTNYQVGPIPSETYQNGYVLFDFDDNIPDPNGFATGAAQGILTSPTIDLTGITDAQISFYQELFYCCNFNDTMWLEFSTDGGASWPNKIQMNVVGRNDRHWLEGYGYFFEYKIQNYISANPANVKIRFNWTSLVADANGQYSNHYYWMIDDIVIREVPNHRLTFTEKAGAPARDITFGNSADGNSKTGITKNSEKLPITFDCNVYNYGVMTQNGVDLAVEVRDRTTNNLITTLKSNNNSTIAPGDSLGFSVLTTSSAWTPANIQDYRLVWRIESDSIPAHPSSEEVADSFLYRVSRTVTGLDFLNASNDIGTFELGDDNSALACRYTFKNEDSAYAYAVQIFLDINTDPGGDLVVEVYDTTGLTYGASGGLPTQPYVSKNVTITQQDIDNGSIVVSLRDANGKPLDLRKSTRGVDTHYFVVFMYSNAGVNGIHLRNDQSFTQPSAASIMFITRPNGGWFARYTGSLSMNAPLIRVQVDSNNHISLREQYALEDLKVYPNPSTDGKFEIEIPVGGDYTVKMISTTGQVMDTREVAINGNERHLLDYSNLAKGIYIIRIEGDDYDKTSRLVIK